MTNDAIVPCLWFDDQAEAAAAFYARTFPAGRVLATSHYPQSVDNPGKKPRGSVLTVDFEIAGQRFTALAGGPDFQINPTISFFTHLPDVDAVNRVFAALKDGGEVLMAIDKYPWSDRYGWVKDRYGVSWQVTTGGPASIAPCFMFSDRVHGQALAAMTHWTRIFEGGRVERVEKYAAGEGPEGTVKHGRFTLAGQSFIAMDSHIKHDAAFNEGVSMQVMCATQAEVDRCWERLLEGGEPSQCGWLKDRFGASWQVVPRQVSTWLTTGDVAAHDRVFAAIMKMKKLDVATLERAFAGR